MAKERDLQMSASYHYQKMMSASYHYQKMMSDHGA